MSEICSYNIFYGLKSSVFNSSLWRCLNISNKELQINGEIRDPEVRLIGADGSQIGVVKLNQALKMAAESGLDLVKIAEKAVPPVCKIIDYGKYKFQQAKKEKESKKNQHVINIKEVRLSTKIDENDFNTKVAHANRFAKSNNKTKVSLRFRGREIGHTDIGYDIMKKFAEACSSFARVDSQPKLEGRSMTMMLSPCLPKAKPNENAKKVKEVAPVTSENSSFSENLSES